MKISLHLLLAFTVFVMIGLGTVNAQTATTTLLKTSTVPLLWNGSPCPSGIATFTQLSKAADEPLAVDTVLNYYDVSTPIHKWSDPFTFNTSQVFYGPAERFTLGTDQGYLDSVHITFDALQGDTIYVFVDPDTLYQVNSSTSFHFVNIYDPAVHRFAATPVYIGNANTTSPLGLTLRFPHVLVTKNFHVVVEPRAVVNGTQLNFTSSFALRGDSEATRLRTADNCHSTFIDLNLQGLQFSNWVVDSFFIFSGDPAPLFSNFDIQAFASPVISSFAVSASSVNFGTVADSSYNIVPLTIKNNGSTAGTLTALTLGSAGPFSVTTPGHSIPLDIPAGGTAKVNVVYQPTAVESDSTTLTATFSDGTSVSIPVTGQVGSLAVSPSKETSVLTLLTFPNPTASRITFDAGSSDIPASLMLVDMLGRTVLSSKFSGNTTLDVSQLEAGRYEAIVSTASGEMHAPVIIAR